jgi:hypothetical protein
MFQGLLLMIMTQGNWLVFEIDESCFSLVWYAPLQRQRSVPTENRKMHDCASLYQHISIIIDDSKMPYPNVI